MDLFGIARNMADRMNLLPVDKLALNSFINDCINASQSNMDSYDKNPINPVCIKINGIYVDFCGKDRDNNTVFVIYPRDPSQGKRVSHSRMTVIMSPTGQKSIMVRKNNNNEGDPSGANKIMTRCNVYNLNDNVYIEDENIQYARKKTKIDCNPDNEKERLISSIDYTSVYKTQRKTIKVIDKYSNEKEKESKLVYISNYAHLGTLDDIGSYHYDHRHTFKMITSLIKNYKELSEKYHTIMIGNSYQYHFDIKPDNTLIKNINGDLQIFDPANDPYYSTFQPVLPNINKSNLDGPIKGLEIDKGKEIGLIWDITGLLMCVTKIIDKQLYEKLNCTYYWKNCDGTNYVSRLNKLHGMLDETDKKIQNINGIERKYYMLIRGMIMISAGLDPNAMKLPTSHADFKYSFTENSAWKYIDTCIRHINAYTRFEEFVENKQQPLLYTHSIFSMKKGNKTPEHDKDRYIDDIEIKYGSPQASR